MPGTGSTKLDSFLKHRRNLFIVAVFTIAVKVLDAKSINLGIVNFTSINLEVLYGGCLITLVYMVIRYRQSLHEIYLNNVIKDVIWSHIDTALQHTKYSYEISQHGNTSVKHIKDSPFIIFLRKEGNSTYKCTLSRNKDFPIFIYWLHVFKVRMTIIHAKIMSTIYDRTYFDICMPYILASIGFLELFDIDVVKVILQTLYNGMAFISNFVSQTYK